MEDSKADVTTTAALIAATKNIHVQQILVQGQLQNVPSIRLLPGQNLIGVGKDATIKFAGDSDGLQFTADNQAHNLRLETLPTRRAIFNDTSVDHLGKLQLSQVSTIGQVQIIADDKVKNGHVVVDGLDVIAADTRAQQGRPQGYGVFVLQGAFTLWNMQSDTNVNISADLIHLSAGRKDEPVIGSGIFVSGGGFNNGKLNVTRLQTDAIYSDGKIISGTPDLISGGVFTVHGAHVKQVSNLGPVVTYGANDMVLDNWGVVDSWIAEKAIISYGASGIGFVNFGSLGELIIRAPIETFGQGARGFNVYDGTVNDAIFDRIITHGDGAVGIQISKPIGNLVVHRGIETFGGTGQSLLKGVMTTLSAIGLSFKAGASAEQVVIDGGIITHGKDITALELNGIVENKMQINGGIKQLAIKE